MPHVNARTNEYAEYLGPLFDDCPKSVLAAIAVSFITTGGDWPQLAQAGIVREWRILHQAGIVPQKPPAKYPDNLEEIQTAIDQWGQP